MIFELLPSDYFRSNMA